MKNKNIFFLIGMGVLLMTVNGSAVEMADNSTHDHGAMDAMVTNEAQGRAILKPTQLDSIISGIVNFYQTPQGLQANVLVAHVPNPGKHGFHIHANGSCEDAGNAAGGPFNQKNVDHGFFPTAGMEHAHGGDMGNIEIAEDGTGTLQVVLPGASLSEGEFNVMGLAVILHEKEDDFGQPTGNAGGRIACGIIGPVSN